MKKIIIALFIVALGTSTAYAASNVIKVSKQWAEIKSSGQTTEVYRISDWETGVTCYFGYVKGNANSAPQMSCVTGTDIKK
jgi:hypothetical protein